MPVWRSGTLHVLTGILPDGTETAREEKVGRHLLRLRCASVSVPFPFLFFFSCVPFDLHGTTPFTTVGGLRLAHCHALKEKRKTEKRKTEKRRRDGKPGKVITCIFSGKAHETPEAGKQAQNSGGRKSAKRRRQENKHKTRRHGGRTGLLPCIAASKTMIRECAGASPAGAALTE